MSAAIPLPAQAPPQTSQLQRTGVSWQFDLRLVADPGRNGPTGWDRARAALLQLSPDGLTSTLDPWGPLHIHGSWTGGSQPELVALPNSGPGGQNPPQPLPEGAPGDSIFAWGSVRFESEQGGFVATGWCTRDGFSVWRFDGPAGLEAAAAHCPLLLGLGAGERSTRLATLLAARFPVAFTRTGDGPQPPAAQLLVDLALACGEVTTWPEPESGRVMARSGGGLLLPWLLGQWLANRYPASADPGNDDLWLAMAQGGRGPARRQAIRQLSINTSRAANRQLRALLLDDATRAAAGCAMAMHVDTWTAAELGMWVDPQDPLARLMERRAGEGTGPAHAGLGPGPRRSQPVPHSTAGTPDGLNLRRTLLLWILATTLGGAIWTMLGQRRARQMQPRP